MTRDEAIKKAQKLLRLSESDNPHEAASALARAQEIFNKFELNQAMLDEEDDEDSIDNEPIIDFADKKAWLDEDSSFNLNRWRVRLGNIIATHNQCSIYTIIKFSVELKKDRNHLAIVGRPSDVEKVRYLYQYFKREVIRLTNRDGKGCGNSWRNNYRHGILDTLFKAMDRSHEETVKQLKAANSTALVKVDKALAKIEKRMGEVNDWVDKNLNLESTGSVPNKYDGNAREQGRIAGHEIKMTKARGALKS